MEQGMGAEHYMVHFCRQPGVADAVLDQHRSQFLRNVYRTQLPPASPEPGMAMIALAQQSIPQGHPDDLRDSGQHTRVGIALRLCPERDDCAPRLWPLDPAGST